MRQQIERITAKLRGKFPKDFIIVSAEIRGITDMKWTFSAVAIQEDCITRDFTRAETATLDELELLVDEILTPAENLQIALYAVAAANREGHSHASS